MPNAKLNFGFHDRPFSPQSRNFSPVLSLLLLSLVGPDERRPTPFRLNDLFISAAIIKGFSPNFVTLTLLKGCLHWKLQWKEGVPGTLSLRVYYLYNAGVERQKTVLKITCMSGDTP